MEDMLSKITRQFLPQMEPTERRKAIASLQAIIDTELLNLAQSGVDADDLETCPHCGSPYYTKRGKDTYGNQRYLCKTLPSFQVESGYGAEIDECFSARALKVIIADRVWVFLAIHALVYVQPTTMRRFMCLQG